MERWAGEVVAQAGGGIECQSLEPMTDELFETSGTVNFPGNARPLLREAVVNFGRRLCYRPFCTPGFHPVEVPSHPVRHPRSDA